MTPDERTAAESAIYRIIYDYARAVDLGDLERIREIFRHGAVRVDGVEGGHFGGDGVVKMFRDYTRFFDDGTPGTKHVTTNLLIDVDDDGQGASASSYFTVLQARPELPLQIVIAGRYEDRYEIRDGSWALVDRFEYCDLIGDMSQHIMNSPV